MAKFDGGAQMKLRIICFPKFEWREDAGRLGEEVERELCIKFEHKEKDIREGGVSSAFFLDEIELFPADISSVDTVASFHQKMSWSRRLD
ncbi:MAG: hypothetical protein ACUVWK_07310 [Nitrososphaerales archaeon]